MKKALLSTFLLLLTSLLTAQYICTPCNLPCDSLHFEEPGTCPHCQMPLAPIPEESLSPSTIKERIQEESSANSQLMRAVSILSDVYGPRLMGTPNYYKAVIWAEKELKSWGISQTALQSFDQGHIGWETAGFSVEQMEPSYAPIHAYPLAFSSSTEGTQTGETQLISSFEEVFQWEGSLKGKIILLNGYYRPVSNIEFPMSSRLSEETLQRAKANPDPNDVVIGYHSRRSSVDVFDMRKNTKKSRAQFFEFCKEQGVIAVIEPSDFPYGILHVDGNRALPSYTKKGEISPIASFVISNEHFGRLVRLTNLGFQPELRVNLQAQIFEEPTYNVNLIAEIEGRDPLLKDEWVIMGAHLDSWHAGTGAVDNASNCAVMMEAMRLIQQTGLKPKRSIRLILWGGEEQIFAGSSAYVNEHIGDLASGEKKSGQEKISAYLNLDNGAGMIRGIYLMGNQQVEPYFAEYLASYPKSQTLTLQNANQTDHEFFDYFNVPAFQFIQDPLDYMTAIHHTNMDVYEYVPEKDQLYNAELIAYLTYQIAQADELLPRKSFNSPIPSKEGNVRFQVPGYPDAKRVYLVGDFNNWSMFGTPLYKTSTGWETNIDLAPGRYYYKYIIDGNWTADPQTPEGEWIKDGKGHGGLTVRRVE